MEIKYKIIKTKWIFNAASSFNYFEIQNNDVTYFDSLGVEHISQEIRTFISNKNIKTNIFRIQAYDSIMCRYLCLGCINFMLAGKTLIEFTNLFNIFSINNFKKNDDIILKYIMTNVQKWTRAIYTQN